MSTNPIKPYPIKTCLLMTEKEFRNLFTELFGEYDEDSNPVEFEYDLSEGLYFCGVATNDVYKKFSDYFNLNITSIHADGFTPLGIWLVYK